MAEPWPVSPVPVMGRRGGAVNSYAPAVEYGVSIDLKPPADSPHLDPLQVEGVGSLLDRILDQVDGAQGTDGEDVAVDRYWVGAHPEGTLVLLVLDADSLEIAEAAAREIMVEVLERSELLTSWRIAGCEVGFDQRFAEAGLQAADGPGVPPEDPAERARWHAEQHLPAAAGAEPYREIDWRRWVISHAPLVRAFDTDVFDAGDGDEQTALLAAGALIFATTMVIDELFQDIKTLAADNGTVADSDGVFLVLEDLPPRFAHHYNGRFAHQFLVAAVMVTGRLSADEWASPASVGEALALHLVVQRARDLLEQHDVLDDEALRHLYDEFAEAAFDDLDHEWLYQADLDGFEDDADFKAQFGPTDMRVGSWFHQIANVPGYVHSFSVDIDAPEPGESPASPEQ